MELDLLKNLAILMIHRVNQGAKEDLEDLEDLEEELEEVQTELV